MSKSDGKGWGEREIWVQNKVIGNFMELLDLFWVGMGGGEIVKSSLLI